MEYMVFYAQKPTFISNPNLTSKNFLKTHMWIKNVQTESLDQVFAMMQGEVWSPNGEARDLIETLGLQHTSMSVGDIIVQCPVEIVGKFTIYEVMPYGFREIL